MPQREKLRIQTADGRLLDTPWFKDETVTDQQIDDFVAKTSPPAPPAQPGALSRFGTGLGESLTDLGTGLVTMAGYAAGRPETVRDVSLGMGQGLYDWATGNNKVQGAVETGIEQVTGLPVQGIKKDWQEGNYAGLAGRSIPALALLALPKTIKSIKARGTKVKVPGVVPEVAPPPGVGTVEPIQPGLDFTFAEPPITQQNLELPVGRWKGNNWAASRKTPYPQPTGPVQPGLFGNETGSLGYTSESAFPVPQRLRQPSLLDDIASVNNRIVKDSKGIPTQPVQDLGSPAPIAPVDSGPAGRARITPDFEPTDVDLEAYWNDRGAGLSQADSFVQDPQPKTPDPHLKGLGSVAERFWKDESGSANFDDIGKAIKDLGKRLKPTGLDDVLDKYTGQGSEPPNPVRATISPIKKTPAPVRELKSSAIEEALSDPEFYANFKKEHERLVKQLEETLAFNRARKAKNRGMGSVEGGRTLPNTAPKTSPLKLVKSFIKNESGEFDPDFWKSKPKVYHGTQRVFNEFDTSKNQPHGLFPGMIHFTENPNYSQMYSLNEVPPGLLKDRPSGMKRDPLNKIRDPKPNTIAAQIGAKNVLDLTKPLTPEIKNKILSYLANDGAIKKNFNPKHYSQENITDLLSGPGRNITNLPFDAIKFLEHGEVNWAVPESTPIRSPYGSPLNKSGRFGNERGAVNLQEIGEGLTSAGKKIGNWAKREVTERPKALWEEFKKEFQPSIDDKFKPIRGLGGAAKAVAATGDMSMPFRQGFFVMDRPEWRKAWPAMIKSYFSESSYKNTEKNMVNSTAWQDARMAGVENNTGMTTTHGASKGKFTPREEQFYSNIVGEIPGVGGLARGADRAAHTFMNKIRTDVFASLMKDFEASQGRPITKSEAQLIARFVNDATGRGSLGKLSGSTEGLANAFFSPKLMASRVKMLTGAGAIDAPLKGFKSPIDNFVAKQYTRSLLANMGGAFTILYLLKKAGYDVETDSRSPDWGKIQLGRTRVDLTGGSSQYYRLVSQLIQKSKKSSVTDRITELNTGKFGASTMADVMGDFFGNKEAPLASFVHDYMRGKDFKGQPFDFSKAVKERSMPLYPQDVYKLYKEDPKNLGLAIPSFFGMGVQTYEKNPFRSKRSPYTLPRR